MLNTELDQPGALRMPMASQDTCRYFFDLVPTGCFLLDSLGMVCEANPAAARMLDVSPQALRGTPFRTYLPLGGREAFAGRLAAVFARRDILECNLDLVTPSGKNLHVSMLLQPQCRDGGDTCLLAVNDVTPCHLLELELELARQATEQANRSKSTFLANMSHELRTPMNVILGMSRLLSDGTLSQEQRALLSDMNHAARTLLTTINQMLSFSRIEGGQTSLKVEPFNLQGCLDMIMTAARPAAIQKGLEFAFDLALETPVTVQGDARHLRHILMNLLGNAITYTSHGQVALRVWPALGPRAECHNQAYAQRNGQTSTQYIEPAVIHFAVSDTGEGIPEDKLGCVFDPFTQVDPSPTRRHGGTGLGLPICAGLVDLMGGSIRAESTIGQGTTVSFLLPMATARPDKSAAQTSTESTENSVNLPALTILLAEDNPLNRRFAVKFLEARGHMVTAVGDGKQAINALSKGHFDIVLMDISMPVMDGLEATRAIRTADGSAFDPAIPIIAVTAHAVKGDEERFLAAGMNAYIAKPLDMDDFERVLCLTSRGYCHMAPTASGHNNEPQVFDIRQQTERFAGMMDFLPELLTLYRSNATATAAKARQALLRCDFPELARAGHTLKGMSAVVAATAIAKTASALEVAANVRDKGASQRLTALLDVQVRQAVEYINKTLPQA